MGKGTVEKFGLKAIVDALDGSDVLTGRDRLSAAAALEFGMFQDETKDFLEKFGGCIQYV